MSDSWSPPDGGDRAGLPGENAGIQEFFKLNGKVAMVTGCAIDLSRGMAVGLAETGVDVVGIYNRS